MKCRLSGWDGRYPNFLSMSIPLLISITLKFPGQYPCKYLHCLVCPSLRQKSRPGEVRFRKAPRLLVFHIFICSIFFAMTRIENSGLALFSAAARPIMAVYVGKLLIQTHFPTSPTLTAILNANWSDFEFSGFLTNVWFVLHQFLQKESRAHQV